MIEVTMLQGPQDGLTVKVPPDCKELRFPVVLDPAYIAQARGMDADLEPCYMRVSIYRRMAFNRFLYEGEQ